jgi:catechol 2,3-dioxygenase-like lactoylglutathione lyase family enzyme
MKKAAHIKKRRVREKGGGNEGASRATKTRGGRRSQARVKAQPLIAVGDVEAASRWYQYLLGCNSGHGGRLYERLVRDGDLLLQLHAWDEEDRANLVGPGSAPHGHGVLLWFEVDDFDAAVGRARDLGAEIVEEVHDNPNARHRELWLRDLDGYVVVITSPEGAV